MSAHEGVTLLKLKKLQILGFKSFCDRTELKFHGEGIAAIIGPNGCGKSNIADAISWVLGEQSAKSLRGSRMEDVIFSGTRDRNPTGMAEVSLTLIDPEIYAGPDTNAPTEIEIQDELAGGNEREENWDEAEIRAQAAAETERAVEEAQPGQLKTEEVEGEISSAGAAGRSDPCRSIGKRCARSSAGAAGSSENPPAQIQPAATPRRRNFGDAPVVPQRRQRIPAEWKTVPFARHPGTVHGNGPGAGVVRAHRAGTHRSDSKQPSDGPPRHH